MRTALQHRGDTLTIVGLTPLGTRAFVLQQQGLDVSFTSYLPEEESLRRLEARLAEACRGGASLFALPPLVGERPASGDRFPLDAVRGYLLSLEPEPIAEGEGLTLYELTRCSG